MSELAAILQHLCHTPTTSSVLATLVAVEGSSYRRPGARLIVTADGKRLGSISGGCLEEDVLARASLVAASGQAELVTYDTTSENDLVWGVGLGCHGVVQVLIEKLPPQPRWALTLSSNLRAQRPTPLAIAWKNPRNQLGTSLAEDLPPGIDGEVFRQEVAPPRAFVIFGAGDDAQPLARLAKGLGWQVTVADPRSAFATTARFPEADALVIGRADELVDQIEPAASSVAVVMTHHYVHDLPILRCLLARPLAFLGLLGPRKRAGKILGDIAGPGGTIDPAWQERLHAPVGLDLGADAPGEVALAIIAEIQATLAGRDARPLRQRTGPIHA